jgi:hypothetical protein
MTVQNLYTKYLNGEITKQKFLYEVRRDQNLTMISPNNSFEDVVKILKNKSIISEKASKESTGKQEVEIVAKTIDMVNPYQYSKGMEYELGIMDIPAVEGDLSEENIAKAQKKVLTNLTKNPLYYSEKICGKGEVSEEWVEVTKKEMEKIGKGKSKMIREGYSAVLDLPNGNYFAIDDDWEDEYQGKNGLFFTIKGNNLYDIDGESIQSSPREFLSQFKPEEILKVEVMKEESSSISKKEMEKIGKGKSKMIREGVEDGLKQMGYSDSDIEDFMDEYKQGGSKLPKKVKDYLDKTKSLKKEGIHDKDITSASHTNVKGEMGNYDPKARASSLARLKDFGPKEGDISARDIVSAIYPLAANKEEITQYLQSLSRAGHKFDNVDDYIEDFKNYVADKSLEEHGEYFDRVSDMNISQSPLEEKRLRIYEKYAQKFNKTVDEVKAMVDEAIALKDRAGNIQYAKDSTEASNIEKNAKAKGITLSKTAV